MRSQVTTMRSSYAQRAIDNLYPRKIFKKLFRLATNHLKLKLPKGSRMNEALNDSFSDCAMRILVEETQTLGYGQDSPILIHLEASLTEAFRNADIDDKKELRSCMKTILTSTYEKLLSHPDPTDQEEHPAEFKVKVGDKRKCDDKNDEGSSPAKRPRFKDVQDTLFSKPRKERRDSIEKEGSLIVAVAQGVSF